MSAAAPDFRLLLVEDNVEDQDLFMRQLCRSELALTLEQIDRAHNMSGAIELLSEGTRYGCILLDLGLPDGNGLENLTRIRSLQPEIPVIILTGLDDELTRITAMRNGAQGFVVKGMGKERKNQLPLAIRRVIVSGASMSKRLGGTPAERVWTNTTRKPDIVESADGKIAYMGPGARLILGYSVSAIVDVSVSELMTPEYLSDLRIIRANALRGEPMQNVDLRVKTSSGEVREVRMSASLSRYENTIEYHLTDVSRIRSLQIANMELADLVSSTRDGIIKVDLEGRVTAWNAGAEKLLGFSAKSMLGESYERLLPAGAESEMQQLLTDIKAGHLSSQAQMPRCRNDGLLVPVNINQSPLRDLLGGLIGATLVLRDVSDLEAAERQMFDMQIMLNANDAELCVARQRLMQISPLLWLGESFSDMLDELDAPMAASQDTLEQLNELIAAIGESMNTAKKTDPQQQAELGTVMAKLSAQFKREQAKCTARFSAFRRLALDVCELGIREFNLESHLQQVLQSLAPMLRREGHRVQLHFDQPVVLSSVPGLWTHIVGHMIGYSLDHSWPADSAGCIEMTAKIEEDEVVFIYRDDGQAAASVLPEKIMDMPYSSKKSSGLGLGLAILRPSVAGIGGSVRAGQVLEAGAEFSVRAPLRLLKPVELTETELGY